MGFNSKYRIQERTEVFFKIMLWIIIAIGIALRLTVYIQNRNLIIDEANVARNLYERGFIALLSPLDYEQYAPPLFLWMEELSTLAFGFSEFALRLYPLLAGFASLFLMRSILLRFMPAKAAWLPLLLLALTYWQIKYATEIKQYMPDVMVTLGLILAALRIDILTYSRKKFIWVWLLLGSLAIWSSMPSVFILSGIGGYYLYISYIGKKWPLCYNVIGVAAVWLVQFAAYYLLILKVQAESDYLQRFHKPYFLTPSLSAWDHNRMRIKEILNNLGGYLPDSFRITVVFLAFGVFYMLFKKRQYLFLLAAPVALTLVAALLQKFSLIDRVILFMMPVLLLIMGLGFAWLMQIRFVLIQLVVLYYGYFVVKNYNELKSFTEKLPAAEITKALDFLVEKNAQGRQVNIHDASKPVYVYYTGIHPGKTKYAKLRGARLLDWDDNYTAVVRYVRDTTYFVYTGGTSEPDIELKNKQITAHLTKIDSFSAWVSRVDVYYCK